MIAWAESLLLLLVTVVLAVIIVRMIQVDTGQRHAKRDQP